MAKLAWQIQQLLKNNREGGMATQTARRKILTMTATHLKELGYNQLEIKGLKEKHIRKLIEKWKTDTTEKGDKGVSPSTLKNRMSHIRWLARTANAKIEHKIPSNESLGIPNRKYVTNISKAITLEQKHLDNINDENIPYSLKLQSAFGLRREESIKFKVSFADRGNKIVLKNSWCKGKRSREIPITNETQRKLLDTIKQRYGNKSLIPDNLSYKEQMYIYEYQVSKSGLGKGHGLRHNYAQKRYKELTGNNCPALGGTPMRKMDKEQRAIDKEVRLIISNELGHNREQVTSIYLGS